MKVLVDNNIPSGLIKILAEHEVFTCPKLGWTTLKNGILLMKAEDEGFDIMVTADQNLRYQQNLAQRRISIIVLGSNRWTIVKHYAEIIVSGVSAATANSYLFIEMPEAKRNSRPQ